MPKKKNKNRSNKQTSHTREARAREARREQQVESLIDATREALPAALTLGRFTVLTEDGALGVTLEEMRQSVNVDLANDGEPPLDGLGELRDLIADDVAEGHILRLPNGLWRFPQMYLPQGWRVRPAVSRRPA